jgi:hypothetical protein
MESLQLSIFAPPLDGLESGPSIDKSCGCFMFLRKSDSRNAVLDPSS